MASVPDLCPGDVRDGVGEFSGTHLRATPGMSSGVRRLPRLCLRAVTVGIAAHVAACMRRPRLDEWRRYRTELQQWVINGPGIVIKGANREHERIAGRRHGDLSLLRESHREAATVSSTVVHLSAASYPVSPIRQWNDWPFAGRCCSALTEKTE